MTLVNCAFPCTLVVVSILNVLLIIVHFTFILYSLYSSLSGYLIPCSGSSNLAALITLSGKKFSIGR